MNPAKLRTCGACGKNYKNTKGHRSKVRCQKCCSFREDEMNRLKSMTLEQLAKKTSVDGKHPSWKFAHVRNLNRSWNANLRKLPCAGCGYSKHVELAHIHPISSFPLTATLGEVNHKDNNVPLCPNCHWEFDNGLRTVMTADGGIGGYLSIVNKDKLNV